MLVDDERAQQVVPVLKAFQLHTDGDQAYTCQRTILPSTCRIPHAWVSPTSALADVCVVSCSLSMSTASLYVDWERTHVRHIPRPLHAA